MHRKLTLIIFIFICSVTIAHAIGDPKNNVIKLNLGTPLNVEPMFELSYERFLFKKFSVQADIGVLLPYKSAFYELSSNDETSLGSLAYIAGIYFYDDNPFGYRFSLSPRFYLSKKGYGGFYLSMNYMYKKMHDERYGFLRLLRHGTSDDTKSAPGWLLLDKKVQDISFRMGLQTRSNIVFEFYFGGGYRLKSENVEVVYDNPEEAKGFSLNEGIWSYSFSDDVYYGHNIPVSIPIGIRLGYRF